MRAIFCTRFGHALNLALTDAVRRLSQPIDAVTPPERPPSDPAPTREQGRGRGGPDLV